MEFKRQYNDRISVLKLCDEVYNGSVTATKYLQQFTKESSDKFDKRREFATFDNFVKRTVDSITNIIFRKPIKIEDENPIFKTIDLQQGLNDFARDVTKALIKDGYTFILVDAPIGEAANRQEVIDKNLRPYFVHIPRERVVNWSDDNWINNEWIIIKELYNEYDGFNEEVKEQYRVFYVNGLVEVYRDNVIYSSTQTNRKSLPIVKIGNDDIPMIYDQAKINIAHLNRNSELDNYIRIASAPIPVSYMLDNSASTVITVGVNDGINFDAPKNEAGFEWVGLDAKNTQAIKDRLEDYVVQMMNIAVTFATSSKIKTATQVNMESTEDESKLSAIAQVVEEGLNKAIKLLGLYDSNLNGLKEISVNRDFDSNKLTPEHVQQNINLYRDGIISLNTLWDLLEKGEVLKIEDKEKEKASLLEV